MNGNGTLEAALNYLAAGYPITVCRGESGKHPMGDGWETDERGNWGSGWQSKTWTADEVERAFQQFNECNVGLQWGPRSGLIDIEADTPEQEQAFAALFAGCEIPVTPTFQSSRGKHRLFRFDPRLAETGKAVVEFQHLGIRLGTNGKGAHSVVPPSPKRSWLVPLNECDPAPLPDVVVKRILAANGNRQERTAEPTNGHAIPAGKRNETLTKIGGSLRRIGLSESEIAATLAAVNHQRCTPRLSADEVNSIARSVGRYAPADDQTQTPFEFTRLTCAQLDSGDFEEEFLIENVLVAKQPFVVSGPRKGLKTSLLVDLALSLALAKPFLGHFRVTRAVRTVLMSGESGLSTLQKCARAVALQKGTTLSEVEGLIWSPDLPKFGHLEHMDALRTFLQENEAEFVCFDPAYLCLTEDKPGELSARGAILRSVVEVCNAVGCMTGVAHHYNRMGAMSYDEPSLDWISGSGFSEFFRQWLLTGRRAKYQEGSGLHELWLSVGGSAGFSSLWGLDIFEGVFPDRTWQPTLMRPDEVRQHIHQANDEAKRERQQEEVERDKNAILRTVAKNNGKPASKTDIRGRCSRNGQKFNTAWGELVDDGSLVEVEFKAGNNRTYKGWKLRPDDQ